jgi:hypothetical protein
MVSKWSIYLAAVCLVGLTACSTPQRSREEVMKDQAKAEQLREEAEERRQEAQQAKMRKDLEQVPRWATQTPKPDGVGLYAVGIGESENLSISMQKAMLQAEFGLAKVYRQEISGSERNFTEDRGRGYTTQFTALIDKLVERVSVVGYEVVEQEVKPIRGAYHTWVLLKLPYDQFNKVLKEQRAQGMDAKIKSEFDDLERRLKERQESRLREDKERQQLRLTEIDAKAKQLSSASADSKPGNKDAGKDSGNTGTQSN